MKLELDHIYLQKRSGRDNKFILVAKAGKKEYHEWQHNSKMLYLTGDSKGVEVNVKSTVDPKIYTLIGKKEDYPEYTL